MMTDKQMEGYKRDYFMRFDHEPVNIEYIWDWIEDLVEEVEREGYKKGLIDQSIRDITN